MDVMEGLEERLNETERRAMEVVQRLEQLDSLQQSLAGAGRGLEEANANISELAAATRAAVESLNGALAAFRESLEVLQRSDPARIEAELGRIREKLGVVDELSTEMRSTRSAVEDLSKRSVINQIFGRGGKARTKP